MNLDLLTTVALGTAVAIAIYLPIMLVLRITVRSRVTVGVVGALSAALFFWFLLFVFPGPERTVMERGLVWGVFGFSLYCCIRVRELAHSQHDGA